MASIKYKDNGEYKDIVVKVGDTLPIGAIIEFDTTGTIPNGWEVYESGKIKKIAPVTPANGNIENTYGTSQTDTYSQEYINNETTKANGCYQGFSNQAQTISGTTPATINNMSLTITTTGKPLFIATNFTGRTSNASYTALVKIYIDGVVKVQRLNTIISTTDTPYSGMALINNLEAGEHTIEIKVVGENTNSSISFPTYITRYLGAWEV